MKLLALNGAKQSTLPQMHQRSIQWFFLDNRVFKVYPFGGFLFDCNNIKEFTNEYGIMKFAKDLDLFYVMHLEDVYLGKDHVSLKMEEYEMDFRNYLRKHRDY